MKRKIAFLLVMALVFMSAPALTDSHSGSVMAASYFQKADFIDGVVTPHALNVRQGPSTKYPVVCVLKKGQAVKVFGMLGDWYTIYDPARGCVGSAYSKYVKVAEFTNVKKNTGNTAATPAKQTETPKKAAALKGVTQDEQTLLNLVNKARTDAGASALEFDMEVMKCAKAKAKDMADNNYFSHQSPTYGSPFDMMRQFGISFKTAGENIAGNQTVEGAFKAWMNSEGHKKNILNTNFNYVGFGIVDSPTYGKVMVQQFIGR
ncbi:putative YkwD family protein [Anaerobacterium chartisolvens]|uniref:Putative YkwD family protein n=1 Tax=Anaerobacterium chartisolvens TaxID=1297424 RepID=A0A369BDX5_9FIRM|nr:CAP domain-containing protein [Anaerobacterium chartisolvens]RCX18808.1 putative YkwD family protein [Anaerobacterium chartisolvens]